MAIPSQGDFLLPFLRLLSDGKKLTREQILNGLTQHFNLSKEDLQERSGPSNTIINRIAWCDVYFVKAGFVEKHPDHHESMQDVFVLTARGIDELKNDPDHITIGYLQSFWR